MRKIILLNDEKLEFDTFPNGETKVNGRQILLAAQHGKENIVTLKYENDSDLLKLLFVKKYLDTYEINAELMIYYMPYSRMDRVEGDSVFTLQYAADYINWLGFKKVTIVEPHSDVTSALINKCKSVYVTTSVLESVLDEIGFDSKSDYLFFPDAGAQKRYGKVKDFNQLVGVKQRDFQTGRIGDLQVVGSVNSGGFKALIVDDLCSYGGTFMLSAKALRELGASEVYLLIAHSEKSIYSGDIFKTDLINKVFATDSMLDESEHAKLKLFKIKEII